MRSVRFSQDPQRAVKHACGERSDLASPFTLEFWGARWVVGTDGHRAAAVQTAADAKLTPPSARVPFERVLPEGELLNFGKLSRDDLAPAWLLPEGLCPDIEIVGGGYPRIALSAKNKKDERVWFFGPRGAKVAWDVNLEGLPGLVRLRLQYLLNAIDFLGYVEARAWGLPKWPGDFGKCGEYLGPLFFTPPECSPREAHRFAVVMSQRVDVFDYTD